MIIFKNKIREFGKKIIEFFKFHQSKILKYGRRIVLVLLLLTFGGSAYTEFGMSTTLEIVLLLTLFLVSLLLFLLKVDFFQLINNFKVYKKKLLEKDKKSIFLALFFSLIILLVGGTVLNGIMIDFQNFTGIARLLVVYSSIFFIVFSASEKNIIDVFLTTLKIICVTSIVIYYIILFLPPSFITAVYKTDGNALVFNYSFLAYTLKPWIYSSGSLIRMNSIFWEPSIFAAILSIGFFIQIIYKKIKFVDVVLYLICLLLSQSTGGIILFAFLTLLAVSINLKGRKEFWFLLSLIFLVVIFFLFSDEIFNLLSYISKDIFGKFTSASGSFVTRLNSFPIFLKIFWEKPIFGYGPFSALTRYNELTHNTLIDSATSSYGFIIASFGITGLLFVSLLFVFPFFMPVNFTSKIIISIYIFLLLNLQNVSFLTLFFIIPFLLIKKNLFQFPDSPESNSKNNPLRVLFGTNGEGASVFKNMNGSLIIKGLSMILGIIAVPLYRVYFETDDVYGLWMAIISLLSAILFFDLGFGSGLRSKLGPLLETGDNNEAKKLVSSTYGGTVLISFILFSIGTILIFTLNFNNILNVPSGVISTNMLRVILLILLVGLCLEFVLKNIIFVLYAKRKSALASFITLLNSVTLLVFFISFKSIGSDSKLLIASIVYVSSVNLPLIVASILFYTKNKQLSPTYAFFSKITMRNIMTTGIVFFLIQIGFMFITQTDGFFISAFFSPSANAEYTYYSKIYIFIIGLMGSVFQQPIWSALSSAKAEKNVKKIKKYSLLTILVAVGLFAIILVLSLLLQFVFNIWLGSFAPIVNKTYIIAFLLYSFIYLIANSFIIIANGLKVLKTQMLSMAIATAIKVLLLFLLNLYPATNTWITIIVIDLLCLLPLLIILPINIRREIKKCIK